VKVTCVISNWLGNDHLARIQEEEMIDEKRIIRNPFFDGNTPKVHIDEEES